MLQGDPTQEHVQGFRGVHKSHRPSNIDATVDPDDVIHIDCIANPDTQQDFILWDDISQVFDNALFVRNKTRMVPFLKGPDYKLYVQQREKKKQKTPGAMASASIRAYTRKPHKRHLSLSMNG